MLCQWQGIISHSVYRCYEIEKISTIDGQSIMKISLPLQKHLMYYMPNSMRQTLKVLRPVLKLYCHSKHTVFDLSVLSTIISSQKIYFNHTLYRESTKLDAMNHAKWQWPDWNEDHVILERGVGVWDSPVTLLNFSKRFSIWFFAGCFWSILQ